ncbi:MAG: DNA-protecting protein DprA [Candidatus Zambryskibacteria bacterium CG10_big_fil_rev_8_21_14_0_10_34_34]|uniref:DNA-protecting protein DprA n=1 Tax=Candidatus Zambryskibacteria bacterium CG10_big_fil_rev_8_21_14_0_10_34_34 TaxID=1975114 RepID=A0A2H0R1I3_9BACT|nr:MAG: DNA-protecting protein DprA [Candidatus Zambryskibacteria bacterium CG10_big_fil_rev_8_21_14_0_10_34_34]
MLFILPFAIIKTNMSYKIDILKKADWPPLLEGINQLPNKLFYVGKVADWSRKLLCVVGARKNTNYGREAVETLIESLRGYPITIVSGLALGIDSIAHRVALKNNLPTIAIPGSGLSLEVLHPQSHTHLAIEIIEKGGMMMNEFEPEFKATQWSFPQRNRIMAGMSHATLVIEAEQKSGTLITARLATEYNRDVLALPGSIFNTTSQGPHMLIRLGATPIRDSDDILEALHLEKIGNGENENNEEKYFDCSEREMQIIKLLIEPLARDKILRQAQSEYQITVGEAQTLLSLLELKGLIRESLGEIRLS